MHWNTESYHLRTHPAASVIRWQSSCICWGVISWSLKKTTPRSETARDINKQAPLDS